MSENPPGRPYTEHGQYPAAPAGFPNAAAGSQPWQRPPHSPSRWPAFLALALAVVASGLAIAAWFRPAPSPSVASSKPPAYSDQQVSDARARACAAFELVKTGTRLQALGGEPGSPPSDDPAMRKAQAANARLSLVAGASYLLSHLDPATPQPIAENIRKLSSTLEDVGVQYLAGAKNADPAQAELLSEGDAEISSVADLCK